MRTKSKSKPKRSKAKSSRGRLAALKAWATRRKKNPQKYGKRKRKVVGFYKDKENGKVKPITKSSKELKRRKVVKNTRRFKGVQPKWGQKARKTLKVGALKEVGYDPYKSERARHMALNKSIKEVGVETTRRRMQYLVNITKDGTKLDRIYKKDLAWVLTKKKHYTADDVWKAYTRKPKDVKPKTVKLKQTRDVRVFRRPAVKTWRYRSKSNPNRWYEVRLNPDGSLSCNCPAWVFKKKGKPRTCRHVEDVHAKYGVG